MIFGNSPGFRRGITEDRNINESSGPSTTLNIQSQPVKIPSLIVNHRAAHNPVQRVAGIPHIPEQIVGIRPQVKFGLSLEAEIKIIHEMPDFAGQLILDPAGAVSGRGNEIRQRIRIVPAERDKFHNRSGLNFPKNIGIGFQLTGVFQISSPNIGLVFLGRNLRQQMKMHIHEPGRIFGPLHRAPDPEKRFCRSA